MASRTILAVGAHAGDMEVSCGAALAKHVRQGDRVVMLHMTPGEGGNPKLSPAAYGEQKIREAHAVAEAMHAEVRFGPYRDGELPIHDAARLFVADVIREMEPTPMPMSGTHRTTIPPKWIRMNILRSAGRWTRNRSSRSTSTLLHNSPPTGCVTVTGNADTT